MHVAVTVLTIRTGFSLGGETGKTGENTIRQVKLFIAIGGLLYEIYCTRKYFSCMFHPDFLYGQEMVVIVYAVITMPVSIFDIYFPFSLKMVSMISLHIVLVWNLHFY